MTIEKLQQIAGSGSGFTSATLTGTVGATVDYEIVVHNSGNVPLTLSGFTDAALRCRHSRRRPGRVAARPWRLHDVHLQPPVTAEGALVNVASVTGTPPGESPLSVGSHEVLVNVGGKGGVLPFREVLGGDAALRGATGPQRGHLHGPRQLSGVKQITFYLDGRKLKTLAQQQAKNGTFSVKINARKLSYGAHRVSIKTAMVSAACAQSASSRVFVRPFAARVAPTLHRLSEPIAAHGRPGCRGHTISIGVPTAIMCHRRETSALRSRMQPCEGGLGSAAVRSFHGSHHAASRPFAQGRRVGACPERVGPVERRFDRRQLLGHVEVAGGCGQARPPNADGRAAYRSAVAKQRCAERSRSTRRYSRMMCSSLSAAAGTQPTSPLGRPGSGTRNHLLP